MSVRRENIQPTCYFVFAPWPQIEDKSALHSSLVQHLCQEKKQKKMIVTTNLSQSPAFTVEQNFKMPFIVIHLLMTQCWANQRQPS